jgi:ABC-2 type transport system permease protein
MRSVLEEKTNRICEVIVSSMKASHLMAGKILGVGSVALLQVSIWAALGALVVMQSDAIAARVGASPQALQAVKVDPWVLASMVAFLVLGFLLYAALFAAVGASVNSDQEAQQYQLVVFLPLIASLMASFRVIAEPMGTMATVLSTIPFSAPIIMPTRMAAAPVPPWQVAMSLVVLAASVVAVSRLAGKIYRVGILSTGQKPTLRELGRWIRAA